METRLQVSARRNANGDYEGRLWLPTETGQCFELVVAVPRKCIETACHYLESKGGVNGLESVGKFWQEVSGCIPAVSGIVGDAASDAMAAKAAAVAKERGITPEEATAIYSQHATQSQADAEEAKAQALAHESGGSMSIDQARQMMVQNRAPQGPNAGDVIANILTGGLYGGIKGAAEGKSAGDIFGSILSGGTSSLIGSPLSHTPGLLGNLFGGGGSGGGGLPGLGGLLGGLLGGGIPGIPSPQQLLGLAPSLLGATGLLGQGDSLVSSAPQLFGSLADPMSQLLRTALRSVDATAGALTGDPAARQAIRTARQSAEQHVAAALRMAEAALAQHA